MTTFPGSPRLLKGALRAAYGDLLPAVRHPAALLFLELAPARDLARPRERIGDLRLAVPDRDHALDVPPRRERPAAEKSIRIEFDFSSPPEWWG